MKILIQMLMYGALITAVVAVVVGALYKAYSSYRTRTADWEVTVVPMHASGEVLVGITKLGEPRSLPVKTISTGEPDFDMQLYTARYEAERQAAALNEGRE